MRGVTGGVRGGVSWWSVITVLLCLRVPIDAAAQSLVGSIGYGLSSYDRMGSPFVAGAELRSFHVAGIYGRFGTRRAWDRVTEDGLTCDIGWPAYEGCVNEPVRTAVTLTSSWLGLGYQVARGVNTLDFGVRRTRHRLTADIRGTETDRPDGQWIPRDPIERWGFDVSAGRRFALPGNPTIRLTYSFDPTDFHGCATDVGTPFCGGATLHVVSVGLAVGT